MSGLITSRHTENGNIRYTALQGKYSDDSDDEKPIPLQTRKETPTMDVEVDPEDTLQAIALKFHCTIAELKRLNNILRENEIHARRTIRVPVRPHSLLSEMIVGVHVSGNSSPIAAYQHTSENLSLIDLDTDVLEEKLKKSSNSENTSDLMAINNLLYNDKVTEVQANIEKHCEQTNQFLPIDEPVILQPVSRQQQLVQKLFSSGDDCGLSWLALVILVLILGFVCPLIYIFYIAEHPEKYHHH